VLKINNIYLDMCVLFIYTVNCRREKSMKKINKIKPENPCNQLIF